MIFSVKFRKNKSRPSSRRNFQAKHDKVCFGTFLERSLRGDFSKAMQIRGHFARHIAFFACKHNRLYVDVSLAQRIDQ